MALRGQLSPEDQIKFLTRVYGMDRTGYVFLPWIDGNAKDKQARKLGFHNGKAFKWPADKKAMQEHIAAHDKDDLYFTPNMFFGNSRIEQNVSDERVLYADLDPVDPESIDHGLRPTIAWESSPGHYQAIWLLDKVKTGATMAGNENHRLTALLEADPGGWDGPQLLRLPGRPNFKPEYKDQNGGKPAESNGLLWADGPRYTWADFADLPAVGIAVTEESQLLDDDVLEGVDRRKVWNRVRLKVSPLVREYMSMKEIVGKMDRSEILWQINRDLADAGCSIIEIVALTRPTVWNKYAGRPDELTLLKRGAGKAVHEKTDVLEEINQEDEKPKLTYLGDIGRSRIPRPQWLVKNIWTRGGLGFIAGAPKSYKSWMGIDLAISVATGLPFLNQPEFHVPNPAPVLYLQEEDDVSLVLDRFQKILESKDPQLHWNGYIENETGDNNEITRLVWYPPKKEIPIALQIQNGFIASDPGWQDWLDNVLEEGKFGLVIIDTLGTTAGDLDTDRSQDLLTKMLRPLRIIARKHKAAICMIHHNKKNTTPGGRAGQDMLGGTALHAWVECALYARSKSESKQVSEIAVEREAKLALDIGFRMRIPNMFENSKGEGAERQLWDPEIIYAGMEESEGEPESPRASTAHERPVNKAGREVANKLKAMGRRPLTFEAIAERINPASESRLREQLDAGVRNGFLSFDNDTWVAIV